LLAIFAGVAGASRPAQACSPPEDLSLYPNLGDSTQASVPTDGVIAFRASATGEIEDVQALLSITVMQGELEVEGTIETIVLSTREDWVISHDLVFVWRPTAPFAAAGQYAASVAVSDAYVDNDLDPTIYAIDVTVGDGPAGAFPAPVLSGGALDKQSVQSGPRVCCDDYNDCGSGDCQAPIVVDQPVLAMTVAMGTESLLSQAYVRMRAGVDGTTEPVAVLGLGHEFGEAQVQHPFAAAAGSYCIAAELVSLIDGTVGEPVTVCVEHGALELGSGPNEYFDGFVEQCIAEPYWEDTDEPYVPGSEEGGSEEGGSEEGGSEEGGSEDSGDDGGLDEDARGCGCDAGGRDSLVPGLLVLVVGAGLRRRRRD
jgi:MYXO-CTERM domain-containing protein